jgi:hypothetical protein
LWYRSLYWRIALGLFAFLALMLMAQGALFLWMTDRIAGSMPARSPRRLAALVASDVSAAMNANASLKLEQYLPEQYGEILQTFVIIMRDGRTFSNHNDVPDALLEAVREEQRFMGEGFRRFGRRGGPGPPPNEGGQAFPPNGGGPGFPPDGGGPGPRRTVSRAIAMTILDCSGALHRGAANSHRFSLAECLSAESLCCPAGRRSGEFSPGSDRRWRLSRQAYLASA